MNACPACSQAVSSNDLVCPKCGISLHPGTAIAGPASGGGKGTSLVLIVGVGLVGILLMLGCLVAIGASIFMARATMPRGAAAVPAGSTIEFELEDVEVPPVEMPSEQPSKIENTKP